MSTKLEDGYYWVNRGGEDEIAKLENSISGLIAYWYFTRAIIILRDDEEPNFIIDPTPIVRNNKTNQSETV